MKILFNSYVLSLEGNKIKYLDLEKYSAENGKKISRNTWKNRFFEKVELYNKDMFFELKVQNTCNFDLINDFDLDDIDNKRLIQYLTDLNTLFKGIVKKNNELSEKISKYIMIGKKNKEEIEKLKYKNRQLRIIKNEMNKEILDKYVKRINDLETDEFNIYKGTEQVEKQRINEGIKNLFKDDF
jgi:hypothetical protein